MSDKYYKGHCPFCDCSNIRFYGYIEADWQSEFWLEDGSPVESEDEDQGDAYMLDKKPYRCMGCGKYFDEIILKEIENDNN
mgnify:CR=1 FL=1